MATFLPAVLRGGVDVVQLRDKELPAASLLSWRALMMPICRDFDVPFIVNDSPELALAAGADGVHVGQEDASVAQCREVLGRRGNRRALDAHDGRVRRRALGEDANYFSAGPIEPTPTKLGRAGTGVGYAVAQPVSYSTPRVRHRRCQRAERVSPRCSGPPPLRRGARAHRVAPSRGVGASPPRGD